MVKGLKRPMVRYAGDGMGEQVAAGIGTVRGKSDWAYKLGWLERTPDKREVGGSSHLSPCDRNQN